MYRIAVNAKRVAEVSNYSVAKLVYDWYVNSGLKWVLLNKQVGPKGNRMWISLNATKAVMDGAYDD